MGDVLEMTGRSFNGRTACSRACGGGLNGGGGSSYGTTRISSPDMAGTALWVSCAAVPFIVIVATRGIPLSYDQCDACMSSSYLTVSQEWTFSYISKKSLIDLFNKWISSDLAVLKHSLSASHNSWDRFYAYNATSTCDQLAS